MRYKLTSAFSPRFITQVKDILPRYIYIEYNKKKILKLNRKQIFN